MPYQEIQALGFPNSPRKLGLYEKLWACISWYGPCTQLVNSKQSPSLHWFVLSCPGSIIFPVRIAGRYTCSALLVSFLQFYLFRRWFLLLHMPYLSLYPGLRCPVYLRPLLDICSASAGRPKKSLLSSFLLLLMGVAGGTMVANSVGLKIVFF